VADANKKHTVFSISGENDRKDGGLDGESSSYEITRCKHAMRHDLSRNEPITLSGCCVPVLHERAVSVCSMCLVVFALVYLAAPAGGRRRGGCGGRMRRQSRLGQVVGPHARIQVGDPRVSSRILGDSDSILPR
jgi:hypothetical protein